jgi:sensor c-di-GMP phosphodiesterase-like protein
MFPLAVAYGLLLLAPLAHNTFSHDGRGIQLLLAAPVRFRDVLLAKNLLHGVVMAVEAVLAWGVVSLLVRPPGAAVVVATFAALLYATLAHFIAGNLLSLWFPRRFDFQKFRAQAAGVTMLAGVGVQIVVLGTAAGVFYLAHREGWMWLAAIVLLALSLVLLWLYVSALGRSDRVAAAQREVLLAELSR